MRDAEDWVGDVCKVIVGMLLVMVLLINARACMKSDVNQDRGGEFYEED